MLEVGGGGSRLPGRNGGSHGLHERLHEAYKCGGGVIDRRVRVRIQIFLLSVFVELSSDVCLINCSY